MPNDMEIIQELQKEKKVEVETATKEEKGNYYNKHNWSTIIREYLDEGRKKGRMKISNYKTKRTAKLDPQKWTSRREK